MTEIENNSTSSVNTMLEIDIINLANTNKCVICLDNFTDLHQICCISSLVCNNCITILENEENKYCPLCRKKLNVTYEYDYIYNIKKILQKYLLYSVNFILIIIYIVYFYNTYKTLKNDNKYDNVYTSNNNDLIILYSFINLLIFYPLNIILFNIVVFNKIIITSNNKVTFYYNLITLLYLLVFIIYINRNISEDNRYHIFLYYCYIQEFIYKFIFVVLVILTLLTTCAQSIIYTRNNLKKKMKILINNNYTSL